MTKACKTGGLLSVVTLPSFYSIDLEKATATKTTKFTYCGRSAKLLDDDSVHVGVFTQPELHEIDLHPAVLLMKHALLYHTALYGFLHNT